MRILCISASMVPSSTANSIQVMKTCQALSQMGHQVHLIVPAFKQDPEAGINLSAYYGVKTNFPIEWLKVRLWMRRYDFALSALKRARALQADLIYTWQLPVSLVALLHRLPLAIELHDIPEGHLGPILFRTILALPGQKRFLPITQALAQALKRSYTKFNRADMVISPDGVDLERYQDLPQPAQARLTLGLPEEFTAGYTGHLYPGRGIGLLVELARRFPKVHFLWVGGRPEAVSEWQNRLKTQGIENITLTGFIENSRLALYQAAADILLMPYERVITGSSGGNTAKICSPMKMFEYMACRRAILSSDLPVIREVLNETNAVFCPPEDPGAWAEAFQSLLENETHRNALGYQAWQDVQPYTWVERQRRALAGFPIP